jgi:hypothetical protein
MDVKIAELVARIEELATDYKIVEILENRLTRVVFTHLDIFTYLRDNGWVSPEEMSEPKQFLLCGIAKDNTCVTIRDEKAFANRRFGKAYTEGGKSYFDKQEIFDNLSKVVSYLNEFLIDIYEKGYIQETGDET